MQTFLPYEDFRESAKVLDRARLGKQRVETVQILKALTLADYGWKQHPATKMWRGYANWLVDYGMAICDEWLLRGYDDTCYDQIISIRDSLIPSETNTSPPPWLGDERLHRSHRSNLTRKDPEYYRQFWNEPDDIPYFWPTHHEYA